MLIRRNIPIYQCLAEVATLRYDNYMRCMRLKEELAKHGIKVKFEKVDDIIELWTERGITEFKNYAELRKALEVAVDLLLSFIYKGRWQ